MEGFGGLVERLDHVALAVRDIPATLPFVEFLGGSFLEGADHERNRFRWVQYVLPGSGKLELLQPTDESSFLTSFLDSRGEGVHHLTFKVTDLRAAADRAASLGYTTTGYHESPLWNEVFLHPRSVHGVLVQLAEWEDGAAGWCRDLDAVLAGEYVDTVT